MEKVKRFLYAAILLAIAGIVGLMLIPPSSSFASDPWNPSGVNLPADLPTDFYNGCTTNCGPSIGYYEYACEDERDSIPRSERTCISPNFNPPLLDQSLTLGYYAPVPWWYTDAPMFGGSPSHTYERSLDNTTWAVLTAQHIIIPPYGGSSIDDYKIRAPGPVCNIMASGTGSCAPYAQFSWAPNAGSPAPSPSGSLVSLSGPILTVGQQAQFKASWANLTFAPRWGEIDTGESGANSLWNFFLPFPDSGNGYANIAASGSEIAYVTYWTPGRYSVGAVLSEYNQWAWGSTSPYNGTGGGLLSLNLSGGLLGQVTVVASNSGPGKDVIAPSRMVPTTPGPVTAYTPQCFTWEVNPGVCGGTGSVQSVKFNRGYGPEIPIVDTGTVVPLDGSGCYLYDLAGSTSYTLYFPRISCTCTDGTDCSVYLGGTHDRTNAQSITPGGWDPFNMGWMDLGVRSGSGLTTRGPTGTPVILTGGLLRFDTDKSIYARGEPVSMRFRADLPFQVNEVDFEPNSLSATGAIIDITPYLIPSGGFQRSTNYFYQYSGYQQTGTYQPALRFLGAGQWAFLLFRGGLGQADPDNAIVVTSANYQPPPGVGGPPTSTGGLTPSIFGIAKGTILIPVPDDANPIVKVSADLANFVVSWMLQIAQWEYDSIMIFPFVQYMQNLVAPTPGVIHHVPVSITIFNYTVAMPTDIAGKAYTICYGNFDSHGNCISNSANNNIFMPLFYFSVVLGLGTVAFRALFG